jgi:C_GCAxxG_C_C family probable redox protein
MMRAESVLIKEYNKRPFRGVKEDIKMESQLSREEIMSKLDQKVRAYFEISGNCAQSSFLALQEQFGLDDGTILKALTPFPGLAFRGGICGTVIGCMMALGLAFGRERIDDWEGYIHSIPSVRAFSSRFKKEAGSIMCYEVIEGQFGDLFESVEPLETKRLIKAGALEKCSSTIAKGVRIAAEIILEKRQAP